MENEIEVLKEQLRIANEKVEGLFQITQSQKATFDAIFKKILPRMNHELSCQSHLRCFPKRACDCDISFLKELIESIASPDKPSPTLE